MPSELYRTYQVLIEETVDPLHPKREKTGKNDRHNPTIHHALRATNEVFQDAVCYYTIMLAGLAGNEKDGDRPLNPLWHEIADEGGKYKKTADAVVRRMAGKYTPLAGCKSASDLCSTVLFPRSDSTALTQEQRRTLAGDSYRIIQQQATTSEGEEGEEEGAKLNEFANNWASILSDPDAETLIPGTGVFDDIHRQLKQNSFTHSDVDRLLAEAFSNAKIWLDAAFETLYSKELRSKEEQRTNAISKAKTKNAKTNKSVEWTAKIETLVSDKAAKRAAFLADYRANAVKTISEALSEGLKGNAKDFDLSDLDFEATITELSKYLPGKIGTPEPQRLRYGKNTNSFEAVLLRYWWISSCQEPSTRLKDAVWKAVEIYVTKKDPVAAPRLNGQLVNSMPYKETSRIAFPLFGKAMLGIATKDRSPWWEFERAAFVHAADDVFKFKRRSVQRAANVKLLQKVKDAALEQTTPHELELAAGKKVVVRGMKDDPRRIKLEAILKELGSERGLDAAYGIDTGTIGGWSGVRERLVKLEAQGHLDETALVNAVDECQTENTQGFGSADFFHALCDPDCYDIWSRTGEQTDAAAANGIKDFVAYYAKYSEWIEDLNDLTEEGRIKPISYTFPGTPNRFGKTSQRHFNFRARLGTRFVFPKLFTEANGAYSLVKTDEERTVTLSARRLKRDRILDSKGESTFALWCPPLVIENGDARPSAGKRDGTTLKMKDVSFSLMVEPSATDANCEPPMHLNVQLPIESKQAGKLCQGQIFFGQGSLRQRHFRWPGDPETIFASNDGKPRTRTSSRDLWCGDGTRDGFSVKVWTMSPKGGWKGETKIVSDFHMISVDLGNRFCAAFARLRVHRKANDPKRGRTLSPDHGWALPIFAQVANRGTLRLQGEDAMVWDHKRGPGGECMKDSTGKYLYELQPEPFGNDGRGRFPKSEELQRFRDLADRIVPLVNLACHADDSMTYPELGDHLAFRLKRRLSRTRMLFKLRWLSHHNALEKHNKHQRKPTELIGKRSKVVEMLSGLAWRTPRDEDEQPDGLYADLRTALAAEAEWSKLSSAPEPNTSVPEKTRRGGIQKSRDKALFRKQCVGLAASAAEPKWQDFIARIEHELGTMLEGPSATNRLLEQVIDWCLPLRGRHWHWQSHQTTPTLGQGPKNECPDYVPLLMGMRGLSMRRLDQVLNLRQLCQSNAKIERRWLQPDRGVNDIVIPRGGELHDPCPDLLKTSNDLREQRVYQTAHLILTEALGLELKNPAEVERDGKTKRELKSEMDLHGAYQPKAGKDGKCIPRCSVIVLEDLSRYRTSQERTRAENSRLMQWAHRKIVDKLSDLAKPFGITIMLVDPAFSSRFDSRTGVAGIRVNEVRAGFDQEMPYAAWKKRLNKSGKKADLADRVNALAETFKTNSGYKATLFLAVEGGKEFFAVRSDENEGHQNADENAAINIGLRALAHPDRLDIFPRFRTRRKNEESVIVNQRRGWFTAPTASDADRELKKIGSESSAAGDTAMPVVVGEDESEESSEHPDYFAVLAGKSFRGLPVDQAHAPSSATNGLLPDFNAYARPLFLKKVQEAAYSRVADVNDRRLAKWRDGNDQIPM